MHVPCAGLRWQTGKRALIMNLQDTIRARVAACKASGLTIETQPTASTVILTSPTSHACILGHEADELCDKIHALWEELGDITREEAELFHAFDYMDLLEG